LSNLKGPSLRLDAQHRVHSWRDRLAEPLVLFGTVGLLIVLIIVSSTHYLVSREQAAIRRQIEHSIGDIADTYEARVLRSLREIDATLKLVDFVATQQRSDILTTLSERNLLPPGLVKAEMLSAETLYERLQFEPDTDYFPAAFAEAERLLEAEGVMSYADLLYRPVQALEADDALRQRVEGFLDHVIVDEYQDINTVQQRLLAVLAGSTASVMAVGDANQCIYEWRGGTP
jgi:superfamily I DNA/RNA helicase